MDRLRDGQIDRWTNGLLIGPLVLSPFAGLHLQVQWRAQEIRC